MQGLYTKEFPGVLLGRRVCALEGGHHCIHEIPGSQLLLKESDIRIRDRPRGGVKEVKRKICKRVGKIINGLNQLQLTLDLQASSPIFMSSTLRHPRACLRASGGSGGGENDDQVREDA